MTKPNMNMPLLHCKTRQDKLHLAAHRLARLTESALAAALPRTSLNQAAPNVTNNLWVPDGLRGMTLDAFAPSPSGVTQLAVFGMLHVTGAAASAWL